MSKKFHKDPIIYRLARAQETYEEALLMKNAKHWNTCANRLYYSCFYAVSALLEKYNFRSSKHSGIKSLFNRNFVKSGKISKEFGKLYNNLLDAKQEGDYLDFVYFDADTIEPWLPSVKIFIDTIIKLINEETNYSK